MSEAPDEHLRRRFARAPRVDADETFVAAVAGHLASRRAVRRARRATLLTLLAVVAVGLAFLLAPFAPSAASLFHLGGSLLALPDQAGVAAESVGQQPGGLYLESALAAVVVALAGVAWWSRRA